MRSMVEGMRAPNVTFGRARELRRAMRLPEVMLWQALASEGGLAGCGFAGSIRWDPTFSISTALPPGLRWR